MGYELLLRTLLSVSSPSSIVPLVAPQVVVAGRPSAVAGFDAPHGASAGLRYQQTQYFYEHQRPLYTLCTGLAQILVKRPLDQLSQQVRKREIEIVCWLFFPLSIKAWLTFPSFSIISDHFVRYCQWKHLEANMKVCRPVSMACAGLPLPHIIW